MRIRDLITVQEEGAKAFPYNIALTDAGGPIYSGSAPATYNDYNSFANVANVRMRTPLTQREAPQHMQTYGGRESIDWLIDAVGFTAVAGASASYHFEKEGQKLSTAILPSDPPGTQLAPIPLINLFKKPNPFQGWQDLVEMTLIDYLIVGNAYWVKWPPEAGQQPLALYRMAPEFVRIVPGRFGPQQYIYRLPGAPEDVTFTPDQVLHFKRPNPNDPYYGLGIVKSGARAFDMEVSLTQTMASYYEKQALPSGVVQTQRRVPRDVFNKLKSQLRSFYGGGPNAGQLMVLEAGLTYQSVSPNAINAGFQQMGTWSRDRIFAMFNLNKGLLGIWDGTGDPNLAEWQLLFDRKTMIPMMSKFSRGVSRALTEPGWGLDFVIDYEESQQPEMILQRAQTLAPLPGIKVHELRAAAGLPPSTGDESIDNTVLNLPGPNMDESGQHGIADANLVGEAGRPPIASNTRSFGKVPPQRKPGNSTAVVSPGKKSLSDIIFDIETHEKELKALPPATHTHVGQLDGPHVTKPDLLQLRRESDLDRLVISPLQAELVQAAHALSRGLLDSAEGKAEGTLYRRIKMSKAWTTFEERLREALKSAIESALTLANAHHISQGYTGIESEADSIMNRNDGLPGIIKTIRDRVMTSVLKLQQNGSPPADINREIQNVIQDWSDNQIVTIAETEATHSYNSGTLDIAEANGITHVDVSDGTDHDEPCKQANGQHWSIDYARKNLYQHPRCRRAFVLA